MVAAMLAECGLADTELVLIASEGDRSRESLASLGGTGVFAGALRSALVAGECDVVVHSLKDLPVLPFDGVAIGAVPRRADARDALCARDQQTVHTLSRGAKVGTGSPRRAAQLRAQRPDLDIVDIRGNVDSRLHRVASGDLDAVVLAAAGLERLGRQDAVSEYLPLESWPSAPGQGALAIEVRAEEAPERFSAITSPGLPAALRAITDDASWDAVEAERGVLRGLEAGCAAPIGASTRFDADMLVCAAAVYRPDGSASIARERGEAFDPTTPSTRLEAAIRASDWLVSELLAAGAAELAPIGAAS